MDRGDYHNEHCIYSIAFIIEGDRSLLTHATNWNRLDVTDLSSGKCLTEREGELSDYFCCSISISPTAKYIVNNGWVWHPIGALKSWDFQKWINGNPFESELDSPSEKILLVADYFWDRPLCWIDENTLLVYGFCNDDWNVFDAVTIVDVENSLITDWFPGPKGNLVFDRYLFAFGKEEGLSIWKLDGTRIYLDNEIKPENYLGDGKFIEYNCETNKIWLYSFQL